MSTSRFKDSKDSFGHTRSTYSRRRNEKDYSEKHDYYRDSPDYYSSRGKRSSNNSKFSRNDQNNLPTSKQLHYSSTYEFSKNPNTSRQKELTKHQTYDYTDHKSLKEYDKQLDHSNKNKTYNDEKSHLELYSPSRLPSKRSRSSSINYPPKRHRRNEALSHRNAHYSTSPAKRHSSQTLKRSSRQIKTIDQHSEKNHHRNKRSENYSRSRLPSPEFHNKYRHLDNERKNKTISSTRPIKNHSNKNFTSSPKDLLTSSQERRRLSFLKIVSTREEQPLDENIDSHFVKQLKSPSKLHLEKNKIDDSLNKNQISIKMEDYPDKSDSHVQPNTIIRINENNQDCQKILKSTDLSLSHDCPTNTNYSDQSYSSIPHSASEGLQSNYSHYDQCFKSRFSDHEDTSTLEGPLNKSPIAPITPHFSFGALSDQKISPSIITSVPHFDPLKECYDFIEDSRETMNKYRTIFLNNFQHTSKSFLENCYRSNIASEKIPIVPQFVSPITSSYLETYLNVLEFLSYIEKRRISSITWKDSILSMLPLELDYQLEQIHVNTIDSTIEKIFDD